MIEIKDEVPQNIDDIFDAWFNKETLLPPVISLEFESLTMGAEIKMTLMKYPNAYAKKTNLEVYEAIGQIREVKKPYKIVYNFINPNSKEVLLFSLELRPLQDKLTEVTITCSGYFSEEREELFKRMKLRLEFTKKLLEKKYGS